jgi:cytochrome c556
MEWIRIASATGVAAALLTLSGCAASKPAAEAQPQFKGVVPINDIMVSVVDHNAHMVWNTEDPKMAPKTDQDWHNIEHAATTLAASGNMILIPGPPADDKKWVNDPQWQKYAQDLTNAGLKAVLAVDHRNLDELDKAGDDLVMTCEACHQKFKPALPAHVATPLEQPEHFRLADEK